MSMLARRVIFRALPRTRGVATDSVAAKTSELWRKISYYVCLPSIIVCSAWVYNLEADHEEHNRHLMEENGGKLPEPPAYEYLNRRVKPYPWGMNSLFFNPRTNKDMEAAAEE
ncbi:mitochondrial cytochrome c oxidase subunit VIa [Punctularia strigosozonata HHB-11173 SS5]|uniref:mitochondrial cytochrome c oxidase subunit VIa n=1 Tax=Punctularia strigosozonata (strain HHB-11173) TaxID=741275 RepID=UPI00044169D6|nr:mitochondrial cytochrome c oxidase subunit VIa [Punctularia strigosozonata HHB-11173 SS5]EIN14114.1 mitochondrial cytochrome c oxidase subunit VIa [Punctularia strigosozonata HHB-11173 SS5]